MVNFGRHWQGQFDWNSTDISQTSIGWKLNKGGSNKWRQFLLKKGKREIEVSIFKMEKTSTFVCT